MSRCADFVFGEQSLLAHKYYHITILSS